MSQNVYSVTSLVHYIKESLDHDFNLQSILIKGEISNFTNHRSGHWYFTLKDAKSRISCVMFASYASRTKFLLKEGMKVIVSASVSMYEASGTMQLYVTGVQNDGLGDLFLQLEQVKQTLSKEGLFLPEHKKELPAYPMRIGVITAKTGAAIQDILTTIARRWPLADVCVYPTLVQGVQATASIIKQLELADQQHHDVILLARGGGSIEDLWCFNEEKLARVIYAMETVIVTGVGHETDTTLVDYVSDVRAPTPTAAAECITPDREEVMQQVASMKTFLSHHIRSQITLQQQRMLRLKQSRYIKEPNAYIAQDQMKLAMLVKELGGVELQAQRLSQRLHQQMHRMATIAKQRHRVQQVHASDMKSSLLHRFEAYQVAQKQQLQGHIQLLDAFSPLKILARGYHITYQKNNIIKCIKDVSMKDEIVLRMQDGILHASPIKKEDL